MMILCTAGKRWWIEHRPRGYAVAQPDVAAPEPGETDDPLTPVTTIRDIIKIAGEYFGYDVEELCGQQRPKALTTARAMIVLLAKEELGSSLCATGRALRRDHSTIGNSLRFAEQELRWSAAFRKDYIEIKKEIMRRGTRSRPSQEIRQGQGCAGEKADSGEAVTA